jgi:diguanylate cyclase (GGDEF)-like protein
MNDIRLGRNRVSAVFLAAIMLLGGRAYALDPTKAITQYVQTGWTNQTGLPQSSVRAIAQTVDGYMWFGTEEGLVRFDGIRFRVFDNRGGKGLPDNYVRRLLVTHDGSLWIATRNAVSQYRDGVFRTFTQADGLFPGDVASLCEGNDGGLWIATGGGLNLLKNGKLTSIRERDGLPDKKITAMAQTADGTLWLGTSQGLSQYRSGRFKTFGTRDGLPGNSVEALAVSRAGSLLVATDKGLVRWNGLNASIIPSFVAPSTDHVQFLLEDRNGNLWIEWRRQGLTRLNGAGQVNYTRAQGLPSNQTSALFEDMDGDLWIGFSDAGVAELRDAKFTGFGVPEGLASNTIWSVLESSDGAIWAGTDNGGVNRITGKGVQSYTSKQGLANNVAYGMLQSSDGSVWVGSEDGWISRIKGGKITKYRDAGSKSARAAALQENPRGGIWIGFHEASGLVLLEHDRFTHYPVPGLVNTLYTDARGGLWIGTDHGGVSRLYEGKLTTYAKKDGLLSDNAQAIYVDKQGTAWAGTSPGGLNRIRDGRITTFSIDQGLYDGTVGAIVEDDFGYLWMTCNKGIFKVLKRELNDYAEGRTSAVHSIVYGSADGMRSPECDFAATPSAWKSRDGRIWFATSDGLSMIDPNHIPTSARQPTVRIESVLFDQKPVSLRSEARLGPNSARLEFQFSAPSFAAPENTRFRYRLLGFDSRWTDAGNTRVASFTNLPPGKYGFTVQAANSGDVWNETGASVEFVMRPHFYQTPWFYGLCLILLVSCGGKIYTLRMRHLLRRNQELGKRVAERTVDLENALKAADIAREALRDQATRDGLTRLWNRKAIFDILENELDRAAREGSPLSILMADLDHFKSINDTYGHLGGDQVLREVTQRITASMRPYDSAGRYGGEEILIILPNCSLADAELRAEELLLVISDRGFLLDDGTSTRNLSLTCSIGAACSCDQDGVNAIVSAADSALYGAKARGRNRVELAVLAR